MFFLTAGMIDLAMRTSRLAAGFAERREDLSNHMAAFLDGGWTDGPRGFRAVFALFEKGAKDVQKGLDLLGENVREGARQYQEQEAANQHALTVEHIGGNGGFNW